MRQAYIKPIFLSVFFASLLFLSYAGSLFLNADLENPKDYTGTSENLFSLHVPKNFQFANEAVPQNDYSIKETIESILGKGAFERSNAFLLFSRASIWFPLIERKLKQSQVPEDFKFIAMAESRLTNSISNQGAAGFWQFIKSTGQNYGLEITNEVDERFDVEKSTDAACRFFLEAHKKFGNWTLAAAAYNLGMGGIEQLIQKQARATYFDLLMNKETAAYVYQALALKTIFYNSGKLYHSRSNSISGLPQRIYKIDTTISDLSLFAENLGYNYDILKACNPWLLTNCLTVLPGKEYKIKLPIKKSFTGFIPGLPNDSMIKHDTATSLKKLIIRSDSNPSHEKEKIKVKTISLTKDS